MALRILKIFLFLFFISSGIKAQELLVNVQINSEKAQISDKSIFDGLKTTITDFMSRKWTDDDFKPEERIQVNILITYMSGSVTATSISCNATAQIQFSRPIYKTSYETIMFNFLDKRFDFEYTQGQMVDFNENTYLNNLSSMLGFYAYVILGMDYDSFSKLGGTKYIETARNIANTAEQMGGQGWNQAESSGRYWLSENLNSPVMTPFREGMYAYHRLALDNFYEEQEEGRKIILESFKEFKAMNRNKPNALLLKTFFLAKVNEIVNIYSQASAEEKQEIVAILKELDPLNADKYNRILQN